jgi:prophage regulatory protein
MSAHSDNLLRKKQVSHLVALSGSQIMRKVTDGSFPAPLKLSARAIAWEESVVRAWIKARPTASRAVGGKA